LGIPSQKIVIPSKKIHISQVQITDKIQPINQYLLKVPCVTMIWIVLPIYW